MFFATDLFSTPESSTATNPSADRFGEPSPNPRRSRADQSAEQLSREQVVDRIIVINPTATGAFLDQFAEPELRSYLSHLDSASKPRGKDARWTRNGGDPAICSRRAG